MNKHRTTGGCGQPRILSPIRFRICPVREILWPGADYSELVVAAWDERRFWA